MPDIPGPLLFALLPAVTDFQPGELQKQERHEYRQDNECGAVHESASPSPGVWKMSRNPGLAGPQVLAEMY